MRLGFGLGLQYSKLSGGGNTDAFIIEIKTDNAGTTNDNQFQFTGAVGDYDVVAKQNGVVIETFNNLSDEATITFANGAGTYTLEVTPKEANPFNRIEFKNGGDKKKPINLKQWGNIVWDSFSGAFYDCDNMLTTATDVPNLSQVTSMGQMFLNATIANPIVTNWNVSNVIDMGNLFQNADCTNIDVSNWNTSSAILMNNMFQGINGNPDVSNWNVSSLVQASSMFRNAINANPDCKDWTPTSLVDGSNMFTGTNMSIQNLTDVYTNWSQLTLQQNTIFGAADTQYFESGQAGKDILVNTYNWTITDGGQV